MTWLPSRLLEASNGVLLVVMFWMLLGDLWYLNETRRLGLRWNYRHRKAAIALGVFLLGLIAVTGPKWLERYWINHGLGPPPFGVALLWLFCVGTIIAVFGGMCWLRVTLDRNDLPQRFWLVLSAIALAAGTGAALQWPEIVALWRRL